MDSRMIVLNAMKSQGATDASILAEKSVSGEVDGTGLISVQHQIPKWRRRDFTDVPIGTPYQYEDQIYKLWQTHDATQQGDWTPDKAVSLWGICHTKDPKLAKLFVTPSGMYMKDDCCKYDGKIYRSKVDNNVYNPKDYPQNWEEVEIL